MESAYLSSELTLLHGWDISKHYAGKKGKAAQAVQTAFFSIFSVYQQISSEFFLKNVLPHVGKLHGLSSAVHSSCAFNVNLKLFDLLGRLATNGIWAHWIASRFSDEAVDGKRQLFEMTFELMEAVKDLVRNNPVLLLPAKDDQAIDIFIAVSLLAFNHENYAEIREWLTEVFGRANFTYQTHGNYPCILNTYTEHLSHPKSGDDEYRKNVTSGSILYPVIALWAALLDDEEMYNNIAQFKQAHLSHCNFQFWYPDKGSEAHFWRNSDSHGAVLSHVAVDRPKEEFLAQVFGECDQSPHFKDLSAVKFGWWPLIIVACRHYRLPLPLQLLEGLRGK